ncbi:dihydrodipicolinate synthase family protein [Candidatus Enterococcus willemsii]|uniref:Dihydrodipicolinate synthase family protein n=1 Tax=Candidatus Enterococcus willemsii TaxID=1857215 RepID=A0ABQ6Z2C0_9ENTE|nr:dihydrodipicolinate synthase family protein [Enterococcus sp. CU12B]KAF1305146.1 dihydrodipicolinate synthase family protein [Enterococcus sp. CU12B]
MFEGIITPIVTPFKRDAEQSINYEATELLIEHLIKHGVNGIFPLGSNGEFHVMSYEEKILFSKFVIEKVNKRVPVYIGTGTCSTRETINLSKEVENMGADALSIITPYFISPSDDELVDYYNEIAANVNLPIIAYNIPKNTGINISKEVLQKLIQIDKIKGIKDSSGDLKNLASYLDVVADSSVNVLVGSDSKISEGYKLGAAGAIAGTSNLITDTLVSLDDALKLGKEEVAQTYQNDIEILRKVLKLGTVPSILKRSIELANIAPVGPARKPIGETNALIDKDIKTMLEYYF